MSWIADLAGKAEDFLVKMDQNAAVAALAVKSKERTTSSNHHSRSSSIASVTSDASPFNNFPLSGTLTPTILKSNSSLSDLSKAVGIKSSSKLDRDATLMASLNLDGNNIPPDSQELLNGDLSLIQENKLLKQEILSLSHEIRQAMLCAKTAEKDKKFAQQQLKTQTTTAQSIESQLDTLRKENMGLADQILDKDAEILTLKSKVEAVQVNQEHFAKIENLQAQLEAEMQRRISTEIDANEVKALHEKERLTYITETEHCRSQLQSVKDELDVTHKSFNEYKLRAQRILQDKDRLLQDIKNQQPLDGLGQSNEMLIAELNQLQQERDLLREETVQSNNQFQQCRKEIGLVESRYEEEIRRLRDQNESLERRLTEEKNKKEINDGELHHLNEELRYVREDLAQQRVQSVGRIQQLEAELGKVRTQLTSRQNNTNSSPSQADLEQRLRSLTDTLISKQAVLEAVQSERSSLLLQLERANKLNSDRPNNSIEATDNSTRVLLNITDDELAKVTTGVSRRMRYAYSSFDSLNFRLGQALRRRPAARLALFLYMVFLHFWVLFVLLTYTPEMHELTHH